MSGETLSLIVWCRRDLLQPDTIRMQLVHVDTSEELHLSEGIFLLRISTNERGPIRCLIRHLTSGREAYVQGGQNLRAFVKACLLNNGES